MEENIGRVTRTTVFVAVILAFVMLATPTFNVANKNVSLGATDNAAAGAGARTVTLGIVGLKGAVSTLNPLTYTMAEEMMVIWPAYSYLLEYDQDGVTRNGDLARKWDLSPNGLFWNFTLTPNAVFYDKNRAALSQPMERVTSRDVIWTFNLIQNATKNNLNSYFPSVAGQPIIKSMSWSPTLFDLHIQLSSQYAPFANALTSIPILPKYIWDPRVQDENPPQCRGWDWDNYDSTAAPVVGSGPWYYNTPGLPQGLSIEMKKSPTWFQTDERGWTLRVDTLVLYSETSEDSNLADFTAGVVDIMMWPSSDQYLNVLTQPSYSDVYKAAISSGFVYEYNLNQMTDAMRAALGGKFHNGRNSQLLQDPIIRKAMAMSVDKQAFINAVRGGLGAPADSLVPASHPYYYNYGSNPSRDTGLVTFDPLAARTLLRAHGWTYDRNGVYVPESDTTTYPLAQFGGANPLQFRFYTLTESPEWDKGARLIAQWAQQAGIDLWSGYQIYSTNQMNGIWAAGDYDTWLWDWVFTPTSEISTDILSVLTTDEIGSWQDIYWSNATFDALYNQSLVIMDPAARKLVTDEMQRMNYEEYACQLIAYRAELYAAAARGPDHWTNWGDWQGHWILTPDQLGPWVYMTMQPQTNLAPKISSVTVPSEWVTGSAMSVSAVGTDPSGVEYRWFFDNEGSNTSYSSSSAASHTYTHDGYYDVYLAVREAAGADRFVNWTKVKVLVKDLSNTPPYNVDWAYSPSSNINAGTLVYLNVTSAVDDQGDLLYFDWNFGDGHTLSGRQVTHQFTLGIPASVNLSVDDHRFGSGTRPVIVNKLISVGPNAAPTCSVPDVGPINPNTDWTYWFLTSDGDVGDSHRYTWDWGDGTALTVTTTNQTIHKYKNQGTYLRTVYADDLTGLAGHNVSDQGNVLIRRGGNAAPVVSGYGVSLRTVVRFQTVTFWANVTDADHDDIRFTYNFGDSTSYTEWQAWAGGSAQSTTTHAYQTTGIKVTQVTVTDGWDTAQSGTIPITVLVGNHEPVITALSNIDGTPGHARSFTASATDVDGDTLVYSWQFEWKNATGSHYDWRSGQSVIYTWMNGSGVSGYTFKVWVNDTNSTSVVGPANVSAGAYAYINWQPWIVTPLSSFTLAALTDHLFSVTAWDNDTLDNTTLKYKWDFGDGTIVTGDSEVTHQYASPDVTKDYTVTVWVDDSFIDDQAVSHNMTSSATVHVETITLKLVAGWNFVTVSRIGTYKASTLGLKSLDVVSSWNPATQTYDKNYVVGVSPPPLDYAIANSTGYWIYAGSVETLYLNGTLPTTPQSRAITVPLSGGWVAIGFNSLNTSWKASNVPGMYSGGSVTTVAAYNSTTGTYKSYITGLPFTDYALVPGQAYWIYVTASGTLTYNP